VLFCWTGTGVSIAANKVPGVRAALCADAETARGARLWNDANVLCLSIRTTTVALAEEILTTWFATHYQPNPTDDACLSQIAALDDLRE
jgi:ribose 5-phosphate isomerase B